MIAEPEETVVPESAAGQRLDRFVADALTEVSRSRAARLIRSKGIVVDGQPRDPDYRVSPGNVVLITAEDAAESLVPDPRPLSVLLETPDLAVIDKPACLVMHPGVANEPATLAHRLVARYPEIATVGHARRPGIVHRLDKDTSGAVVVARTAEAYHTLQRAFEHREVKKTYLAIVRGRPAVETARIDAPVGRHLTRRTHMAVTRGGRDALTEYRLVGANSEATLLEVRPETGRTHQIRVHLASIGHPIVGDSRYGPRPPAAERPLLHAWQLEFADPAGERWRAASAPPEDIQTAAGLLGLELPATPATERLSVQD